MMQTYTLSGRRSASRYASQDSLEDALFYLKHPQSFRTFSKGLTELLQKKGFSGDSTKPEELADYLFPRLQEISSGISRKTLLSWLSGKHSPKIEASSRRSMYELCFALNLTYEETLWFFQHVYYDRAFNCHTITESVFYYAFLHGLSYAKALKLIEYIESAPAGEAASLSPSYTHFVQSSITNFRSAEELTDFLIRNRENFHLWNQSAQTHLHALVNDLLGSSAFRTELDRLKRLLARNRRSGHLSHPSLPKQIRSDQKGAYGLILQEIFFDACCSSAESAAEAVLEQIEHQNVFSYSFLLRYLLSTSAGTKREPSIPYVVRNNFPSKKVLSDVLSEEKLSVSKSYDSIRKMLVLLDFYRFWVRIKLGLAELTDIPASQQFDIYLEEADHLLWQCGYEGLYAGNPYDWIFLCAGQSENPLDFFRSFISELLPE